MSTIQRLSDDELFDDYVVAVCGYDVAEVSGANRVKAFVRYVAAEIAFTSRFHFDARSWHCPLHHAS